MGFPFFLRVDADRPQLPREPDAAVGNLEAVRQSQRPISAGSNEGARRGASAETRRVMDALKQKPLIACPS